MDREEQRLAGRLMAAVIRWAAFAKRWGLLYAVTGQRLPEQEVAAERERAQKIGSESIRALSEHRFVKTVPKFEFRARGLDRIILERTKHWRAVIDTSSRATRAAIAAIPVDDETLGMWRKYGIGRRTQDDVRKLSLQALERAFERESPIWAGKQEVRAALEPLVRNVGGVAKIPLRVGKPPASMWRMYDADKYAELVSLTTVREAEQEAFFADADRIGTDLVKMPYFPRDYSAEGDIVCERINGQIFSLKPGGSRGSSGKEYPYLYGPEGIGATGYLLAHPHCRHIARPIPQEVA